MPPTSQAAVPQRNTDPLEEVLRKLRERSGFPTLSTTISDINRVVASETHSTQQLAQVILRDVSLTTKLLQLVNSATFGQYRGQILTVSKAVLILGAEAVRNAAMTLMMLEFSRGRSQEKSIQDELIGAFFAGVMAKSLCRPLGLFNGEEAVICSMCQSLGKLLVTFFLFDESKQIRALVDSGLSEERAAAQVLGISYQKLGMGVAKHWSLPNSLLGGMESLAGKEITKPANDVDSLRVAANLANELYRTALGSPQSDKQAQLEKLSRRYSAALKIDPKELIEIIRQGLKELAERSTTVNLPIANSPALNVVRVWTGGIETDARGESVDVGTTSTILMQEIGAALAAAESEGGASPNNRQQVLSAGIRDITETLTSNFALNDVLQMALEVMYRGLGCTRTMIFIRDPQSGSMRARFGFGADIERVVPLCRFPLQFVPDVFHVATEKAVDIVIENTQAENVVQRIPDWHRTATGAKSFLLLPVVLKNNAVGLLYADSDRLEGVKVSSEQLDLLRTLRTQVVLAFKQSAGAGGSR